MPTAPVKRCLEEMSMPLSKRYKKHDCLKDTNIAETLPDKENNISSVCKLIDKDSRSTKMQIQRKPPKIKTRASSREQKEEVKETAELAKDKLAIPKIETVNHVIRRHENKRPKNIVYKCRDCWRKYPLRSQAVMHSKSAHRRPRPPLSCSICGVSFSSNTGEGPWKECCKSSMKLYCLQRTFV